MGKSSNSTSSSTRSGVKYVDGLAEGLPMGWKVEIKARGSGSTVGRKYKCYIAPLTGRKLYSKGEVSRYLNSRPQQDRSVLTQSETQEVTKESDTVDELPPGLSLEKLNGNLEKGEFIFGECSKSEDTVKAEPILESLTVEGGESAELTKVVSLDAKSSKKRKGRKASVKEGLLSTQPTNVSRSEKQLLENGVGEHEKRKFQLGSRKRKNQIDLSTPRRASKRLAGINAELPSEVDRPIVDIHMAPVPIAGNAELASEVERSNWATHLVPVPIDGTNVELASEVKRPNAATHIVPVPMAGTDAELATDVERSNRAPQLAQINAELVSDVERLNGVISVASVPKRLAGTNAALASDVERPNGAPRVTTLPKQLAEVSADIPSDVERPNGIPQVATVPKQLAGINSELASVVERPNGAPQVETVPKQLDGINANLALDVGRLNGTPQVETVPEQLAEITPELASDVGRSNEVPQVETVPKQLAGIKAELGSDIERPNETLQVAPVPPPPEDNMAVNSTSGGTACLVFEQSNQHESEKAGNSTAHAITGEDPLRQEGCPAGAEQHTTTSQASRVEAALKQGEFDSGTVEHTATHLISDTLQDQDTLGKVDIGTKADEKQESALAFPFGELWPDPCLEFAYKTLTGAIPMDDNLAGAIPISDPCLEFAYKTLTGELPVEDNLAAAIPTSDPCLEFAYKTLTGEISLEDSLAVQDYFQNQMSSTHTKNNSMELPDFNVDDLYQNDNQFDSIVKPACPNQVQNQTSRVSTSESEQGFSKESVQRPSVNKEKMDCNRKEVNP